MANYVKIRIRRDTSENWAGANPLLLLGEIGADISLNRIKVGDGNKAWNDLGWINGDLYNAVQSILKLITKETGGSLKDPVNTASELATKYPLPVKGDIVYVINEERFYYYDGTRWKPITQEMVGTGNGSSEIDEESVRSIIQEMLRENNLTTTQIQTLINNAINGKTFTEAQIRAWAREEAAAGAIDEAAINALIQAKINNMDIGQAVDNKLKNHSIFGMTYYLDYNATGKPTKIFYADNVTATIYWDGNNVVGIENDQSKEYIKFWYNASGTFIGRYVYKNKAEAESASFPFTQATNPPSGN